MAGLCCSDVSIVCIANKRKRLTNYLSQPLESLVAQVLEPVFGRNGEFLTAVTTAGRKDAASVGGGHALAETVLVDTFAS